MGRGFLALTVGLVSLVAVATTPAPAKSPVSATLENPALLQGAAPHEPVTIAWTQDGPARLPGGPSHTDLRSIGVYVSLRGTSGGPAVKVAARPAAPDARGLPAGRYIARATVPAGGIASLAITVEGLRSRPGDPPEPSAAIPPSEMLIANDPFTVAARGGESGATVPWGALALWLGALGLLLGGYRAATARPPAT